MIYILVQDRSQMIITRNKCIHTYVIHIDNKEILKKRTDCSLLCILHNVACNINLPKLKFDKINHAFLQPNN